MLDVHPAHHAATTWREFFIHIATIVIGLLIAVGLEQTIEFFHHQHQRHQLEEDLREEGEKNKALIVDDLGLLDDSMAIYSARIRRVETELASRDHRSSPWPAPSLVEPPPSTHSWGAPSSSVWLTGQEDGALALLPRQIASQYQRPYRLIDQIITTEAWRRQVARTAEAYACRFSDGTLPCKADITKMSKEELSEYKGLLTQVFTATREVKGRLLAFGFTNELTLEGRYPDDLKEFSKEYRNYANKYPDVYLMEAK